MYKLGLLGAAAFATTCASTNPPADIDLEAKDHDFYAIAGVHVSERSCHLAESNPVTATIEGISGNGERQVSACLHNSFNKSPDGVEALKKECNALAPFNISSGSFIVGISSDIPTSFRGDDVPDVNPARFVCVAQINGQEKAEHDTTQNICKGEVILLKVVNNKTGVSVPFVVCDDRIPLEPVRPKFACSSLAGYTRTDNGFITMRGSIPYLAECGPHEHY